MKTISPLAEKSDLLSSIRFKSDLQTAGLEQSGDKAVSIIRSSLDFILSL